MLLLPKIFCVPDGPCGPAGPCGPTGPCGPCAALPASAICNTAGWLVVELSLLSNITEVCDDPGSAAIRIPSFATVPLSHAFTSAVASIVIKLLAALTGTCHATTIPAAGAFVPFTVASIHVPFAAL